MLLLQPVQSKDVIAETVYILWHITISSFGLFLFRVESIARLPAHPKAPTLLVIPPFLPPNSSLPHSAATILHWHRLRSIPQRQLSNKQVEKCHHLLSRYLLHVKNYSDLCCTFYLRYFCFWDFANVVRVDKCHIGFCVGRDMFLCALTLSNE